MGRTWILISLLGAVLALASTPPLHAQEEMDLAGVQVTPARTEEDQTDRRVRESVIFVNEEETAQDLVVAVTGLGHDLDGNALFPETTGSFPEVESEGVGRVSLAPGDRHEVRVDGRFVAGEPSAYFAVVATFVAEGADAATVQSRVQLGSIFLLRGPRPWNESVAVRDAGLRSSDADGYEIFADVENQGDVHVRPEARVDIFDAEGELLGSVELQAEVVIPGYARRLTAPWAPDGTPRGPLRLEVRISAPEASAAFSAPFPPDPSEDLRIRTLTAARSDAGDPLVVADVENTGATSLQVAGDLTLEDGPGGIGAGPFATLGITELAVGETAPFVITLPGDLPVGPWRGVFTARAGELVRSAEATIVFPDEAGTTSEPVEATPIFRDRGVLVPLAIGLLILALALVLLVWFLAKRRRTDEDEADAVAVETAASPGE